MNLNRRAHELCEAIVDDADRLRIRVERSTCGARIIDLGVDAKGGLEAGKTVINNVEVPTLAVSLGGIESLIEHPASMTHAGMPADERKKADITDDLVRIAVGCESYEDLEADMARVLDMI